MSGFFHPGGITNCRTIIDRSSRFGYGPHACPGRFYAVRKAKIILGRLIQKYEIKWDGVVTERPPGMALEAQLMPNMKQKILIRNRRS